MTDTLRTLIVDDEPLAVERLQILAARIPALAVVGAANDGAQALRLVEALAPDLLLLDMTMPEADGLAVARRLLSGPLTGPSRPAVIFVTAHDHFAVEAFDCDAVDYVLKPVAQDRLERAVERTRAPGMPAPTETPAPAPSETTSESEWIEEFWVPIAANSCALPPGTSTASMPSATMSGSTSGRALT
jgi:two-component system response regulator AlgR